MNANIISAVQRGGANRTRLVSQPPSNTEYVALTIENIAIKNTIDRLGDDDILRKTFQQLGEILEKSSPQKLKESFNAKVSEICTQVTRIIEQDNFLELSCVYDLNQMKISLKCGSEAQEGLSWGISSCKTPRRILWMYLHDKFANINIHFDLHPNSRATHNGFVINEESGFNFELCETKNQLAQQLEEVTD